MTKLMNKKQEIKNRIDLINKGEVPEEYKKRFGYIVPNDWDIVPIKKVVTQVHRSVDKPNEPYYRLSVRSHAKGTFHSFVEDPETVAMEELYKVKENDLIVNITFAWEHAIAIVKKEDDGLLVSHRFPTYEFNNNVCVKFYENIIKFPRIKKMLGDMSPGGAGRNRVLNQTDFYNKLYVPYTSRKEQEKIAEILSCCDKVIELKEQLIKHYYEKRNFIIGYFFKNIKSKNIVKLGDICEMFSGGTPSVENRQYYNNGTIPFIKSGEIENDKTEDYITEDGLKNSSAKLVKQGDLLVALYGANSGNVALSKISGAINQAILCIRSSFIDCYYLLILLKFNKDRIIQKYLQGGQGNLSAQIIKSLKFKIPTIEEQKKIVTIISNIDKELKLLEQELEQYKQLKKALSQLLLTGIVRTME